MHDAINIDGHSPPKLSDSAIDSRSCSAAIYLIMIIGSQKDCADSSLRLFSSYLFSHFSERISAVLQYP